MKKAFSLLLTLTLLLACVSFASAEAPVKITYFGNNAMSGSGELSGGLGKYFTDRGLSIEVVPYSAEKLQAQLASGDLADVIWLEQQEMLIAAESGLILPLDEYIADMPAIAQNADLFDPAFNYARQYNSNGTGNLYYIGRVGASSMNVMADTERHAIKMNWKVYAQAGHPAFSSLEDIIPILQQMKEIYPETEDGIPTYGINLFSDFDTNYFWNIGSIYSLTGKDVTYLPYGVEYDTLTQTGKSLFAEDSEYYHGLKFLYEMNQAGLVDPDSLSQTRSAVWAKIDSGAALAGWSADPGWENQGYYPVVFDDFIPTYSIAQSFPTGGYCIASTCENVEAAVKLINMLADEKVLLELVSGYEGEDMRWVYNADGIPTITETFAAALNAGTELSIDPDKNIEFWNIMHILSPGVINSYGVSYNYTLWPSYYEITYSTDLAKDWSETYGYPYLKALLEDKNWTIAAQAEGFGAFLTPDDDLTIMTKAALKDIIVPGSWRMVFAADEAEFDSIWTEMKTKCESLGIDTLVNTKLEDIANARQTLASLSN